MLGGNPRGGSVSAGMAIYDAMQFVPCASVGWCGGVIFSYRLCPLNVFEISSNFTFVPPPKKWGEDGLF